MSLTGLSDAVLPGPPNLTQTSFPSGGNALNAGSTFTIASVTMPGKWTLVDAKKVFGWQIQQGSFMSGATVLPIGDRLVTARFRGEFWDPLDFALYKEIRKSLLSKPVFSVGGTTLAAAMGIDHPELKALGVTEVVIAEVGAVIQAEAGLWVTVVDFLQYRKPVIAPPKPTVVIPDVAPPVPTAQSKQELEIQKLNSQVITIQGLEVPHR